jgi:hypothetical protein
VLCDLESRKDTLYTMWNKVLARLMRGHHSPYLCKLFFRQTARRCHACLITAYMDSYDKPDSRADFLSKL